MASESFIFSGGFFQSFFISGWQRSKGLSKEELNEASLDQGRWKKKGLEKQNTCFVTGLPFHVLGPPESTGYSGQMAHQEIKLSSFCREATPCVAVVLLQVQPWRNQTHSVAELIFYTSNLRGSEILGNITVSSSPRSSEFSQLLAAWTYKWHFL